MIFGFSIFAAIFAFALVIFIHELGHYFVGRLCGIAVTDFSIGFGPALLKYKDKNNTEWKLCLIPLGGYVKFLTEDNFATFQGNNDLVNNDKLSLPSGVRQKVRKSFEKTTLKRRSLTVLAGPFANFIFSLFVFAFLANLMGTTSNEPIIGEVAKHPGQEFFLEKGDRVLRVANQEIDSFNEIFEVAGQYPESSNIDFVIDRDSKILRFNLPYIFQPIVFNVELFSPAMKAGIESGDVFLEARNKKLSSFSELKEIVNESAGDEVLVKYWRDGLIQTTVIKPEMRPTETASGDIVEVMRIGIRGGPIFVPERVKPDPIESLYIGFGMTYYVLRTSLVALVRMIDNSISAKHLSGPLGVAKALSYSATDGFVPFLSLLAAISAGLGLVNLFPIPILDGGHLLLFLYEGIMKKPPPPDVIRYLMFLGLSILVVIMVFATFNDIIR